MCGDLILLRALLLAALSLSFQSPTDARVQLIEVDAGNDIRLPALLAEFGIDIATSTISGPLSWAFPIDACAALQSSHAPGDIIVAYRGGDCTFAAKVAQARRFNPAAVIIISLDESFVVMGGDPTPITSIMVDKATGAALKALPLPQLVAMKAYVRPAFDWSTLFIFLIAVGTAFGGAMWGSRKERLAARGAPVEEDVDVPEADIAVITLLESIGFLFIASIVLVVLFFFIDYLIYVVLVVFAIGGTSSMVMVLAPVLRRLAPRLDHKIGRLPCIGYINPMFAILIAVSASFSITWFVCRHALWSWVLQDCMGIALMLMIQRVTRMPSLKIATILLGLAFFYDIFWVFLSPFFFTQSVMVQVAMGGATGERMPMLIAIPRFHDLFGGMAMIGFGDIALPGLFLSFLARFDASNAGGARYFPLAIVGYAIGLLITDIALVVTGMGQPALLYLVPSTVGLTCLVAWRRGQFALLWSGGAPSQEPLLAPV